MKALILAGGYGSRLGSITESLPKPMVEIGGKPILWHIMKIYAGYGVKEFVILTGYKSSVIKNYFANYSVINNDFKVELESGKITFLNPENEDWDVTVLDTGLDNSEGLPHQAGRASHGGRAALHYLWRRCGGCEYG